MTNNIIEGLQEATKNARNSLGYIYQTPAVLLTNALADALVRKTGGKISIDDATLVAASFPKIDFGVPIIEDDSVIECLNEYSNAVADLIIRTHCEMTGSIYYNVELLREIVRKFE